MAGRSLFLVGSVRGWSECNLFSRVPLSGDEADPGVDTGVSASVLFILLLLYKGLGWRRCTTAGRYIGLGGAGWVCLNLEIFTRSPPSWYLADPCDLGGARQGWFTCKNFDRGPPYCTMASPWAIISLPSPPPPFFLASIFRLSSFLSVLLRFLQIKKIVFQQPWFYFLNQIHYFDVILDNSWYARE